ncbi:hypothetical protein DESUT3_12080 [Desulfuromonas versatilis]|uniref:Zinc finger/thioredoxin putative domain-containing protein n=1 Tax=Desulfuromonas versatilis TaxID=2802975 RepID=A0ABN6DWB3_9BACT|nr:DUF3426 domain-containing protein [Desulfuromonas versatilis]BCR04139.1 hypothetical protein DESUT3_12080 [Desulfuromonas versatilis]
MIIQCPECQTRFKVADDKVKPGGIKVRCAKCRHIFLAQRPQPALAPEQQPPEPAAEKPAENFAPPEETPPPTQPEAPAAFPTATAARPPEPPPQQKDQFDSFSLDATPEGPAEEDFEGFEEFSTSPDAAIASVPPAEQPDESEETWDAGFGEESAEQAFGAEFAGDEEQRPLEDEFDFGAESEPFPSEAGPDTMEEELAGEEEAGLDSPDEFSFSDEPEAAADELSGDDFAFEEALESGAGEKGLDFAEEPPAFNWEEETESGAAELSGAADEFDFGDAEEASEEAEEFDFSGMTFGEEESPEPARSEPDPEEDAFGSLSLDLDEPAAAAPAAAAAVPPAAAERQAAEAEEEPLEAPLPVPKKRKSALSGLTLFLLLLLFGLLGAAGYFIWSEGSLDQALQRLTGQQAPARPAGQIRLSELNSFFVNNLAEGQLFVISGQAINEFTEARSAVTVKGVLFDKNGKALVQQTVFCGNALDEDALRSMPFSRIEESMNNQFGDSLSNLNIGAGKAIPFTIVFKNLPPDLAEFIVEVVDSKPASK